MNSRKLIIAALLLAAIGTFFALDLGRYVNLAFIKDSQASFQAAFGKSPALITLAFFAAYVAVTALSLPGATLMTLAAGAGFGLVLGTVVVSFASTLGATLAMLTARYLLRDSVQARFGRRLDEINKGIEQEGAFYLLSLRLIPLLPFFVLNLLMGLTRIKTWTYAWVSQLGMLAATVVYVNAGTQLAKVDSLQSIASPGLIGSFVLLGALPLLVSKALKFIKRRRVYARWQSVRPARFERNLVVIGAGAGGLVSAYIAAVVKAKVTLVESHKMGGDCLNYGCVPSKALIRSARLAHQMRHRAHYGLGEGLNDGLNNVLNAGPPAFSFKAVMQRIEKVIRTIAPHDSVARYTSLGVEVLQEP